MTDEETGAPDGRVRAGGAAASGTDTGGRVARPGNYPVVMVLGPVSSIASIVCMGLLPGPAIGGETRRRLLRCSGIFPVCRPAPLTCPGRVACTLTKVIVLVTGGSSGIGHATVRRLARGGHRVFSGSRDPKRAPLPEGVTPLVLDVASVDSALAAVDAVMAQAGGLDALVNNAGIGSLGPIEETPEEEAHRVLEVNFFGPLRLARLAIPVMRAGGGGRIVNVTSMNDVLPAPFGGFYSASKAALASASYVLGAEVAAFGIRVTVVAPGLFRTAMADELGRRPVDPVSSYRAVLESLRGADGERLAAAGDPDRVAVAVEECLVSGDPPARVVVGADAEGFERLLKDAGPEDLAAMLRDYVTGLSGPGASSSGA